MSNNKLDMEYTKNINLYQEIAIELTANYDRSILRVQAAIENINMLNIKDAANAGLVRDIKLYYFQITGEKLNDINGLDLKKLLPEMQTKLLKDVNFAYKFHQIFGKVKDINDPLYLEIIQAIHSYTPEFLNDMIGQKVTKEIQWVSPSLTCVPELIHNTATKIFDNYKKNGFHTDNLDDFINNLSDMINLDIKFTSKIKEDKTVEYQVKKNGKTTIIDLQENIDKMVKELESVKKRGEQYLGFSVIIDFLRDCLHRVFNAVDPSIKQSHLNQADNYLNQITTKIINPSASSQNPVLGSI